MRTPSSRRGPAACVVEAWKAGAKRNVQPTSSKQRCTSSGGVDAHPQGLEHVGAAAARRCARLPCLATLTPQAATTSEATVETLKVRGAVAAGAAGVERSGAPNRQGARRMGARTHHLVVGLALHGEGREERPDLRRGGLRRP